jgi:hypothetical protein
VVVVAAAAMVMMMVLVVIARPHGGDLLVVVVFFCGWCSEAHFGLLFYVSVSPEGRILIGDGELLRASVVLKQLFDGVAR